MELVQERPRKRRVKKITRLKKLITLCRLGKLYEVEKWIKRGRSIKICAGKIDTTPLCVAAESGFYSLAELLLRSGCSPEEEADWHPKAIACAAKVGRLDIVKLLLQYGADLRAIHIYYHGCLGSDPSIVDSLISLGVDPAADNGIARALCDGNEKVLEACKDLRDRFPKVQFQFDIALRNHCRTGNAKWAKLLLSAGANPRSKVPWINDEDNEPQYWRPAIETTCRFGYIEILKDMGVDPRIDDLDGLLNEAGLSRSTALIQFLLNLGADPNVPNEFGRSLLDNVIDYSSFGYAFNKSRAVPYLSKLVRLGAKWQPPDRRGFNELRSLLVQNDRMDSVALIKSMKTQSACPSDVLKKLLNTKRMKEYFAFYFKELIAP